MLKNRLHLTSCNAREPLEKIVNGGPVFKIIKKRINRYAGPLENPRSADSSRLPLYG